MNAVSNDQSAKRSKAFKRRAGKKAADIRGHGHQSFPSLTGLLQHHQEDNDMDELLTVVLLSNGPTQQVLIQVENSSIAKAIPDAQCGCVLTLGCSTCLPSGDRRC